MLTVDSVKGGKRGMREVHEAPTKDEEEEEEERLIAGASN